jgi:hypothetical protein
MKLTGAQYIRNALLKLNVIGEQETPNAKAISDGMTTLLFVVDSLNADQLSGCFSYVTKTIPLIAGEPKYLIGPSSLPDPLDRPIAITAVNVEIGNDDVTYPVTFMSQKEYSKYSLKSTNQSIPTKYFYNPGFTDGEIFLYPAPSSSSYKLNVTYKSTFTEYMNPNDYLEFPPGFAEYFLLKLTKKSASSYGVNMAPEDVTDLAMIEQTIINNSPEGLPSRIYSDMAPGPVYDGFVTYIPTRGG